MTDLDSATTATATPDLKPPLNPPAETLPPANLYEHRYQLLEALLGSPLPSLPTSQPLHLQAEGQLDLVIEALPRCEETGGAILTLAHYARLGSHLCSDPSMVLRYFPPGDLSYLHLVPSTDPSRGRLEALHLQQEVPFFFLNAYLRGNHFLPALRDEVNRYLGSWLQTLEIQGYSPLPATT
ncbi:MAG: hypothetical protein AAGD01_08535 [Acidobacteriota bacterium]